MYRVGMGFDAHKFKEDRKLIIGGVEIAHTHGLMGHSDADVLTHAICDAILGALGLGDIGSHYPDTDPKWEGVSSLILLEDTLQKLKAKSYMIQNIDSTIVCQQPKISPHVTAIKDKLSEVIGIDSEYIGVKATTTEGMGFTGRGEGIAAYAVVIITDSSS